MKRNILRIAMALLAFASSMSSFAQSVPYVNVDLKDGSEVQFQLADKPEFTITEDKFVITAGTEVTEYAFADVAGYHFTDQETAIGSVQKGSFVIRFVDNENVIIQGNDAFSAQLYDAAGRLLDRKSVSSGEVSLSLAGQTAGVYVVKVSNGQNYKFLKK